MDGYSGHGIVHQHAKAVSVVFRLLDVLIIILAFQAIGYVLHEDVIHSQYIPISLIAIIVFYTCAGIFGVYQSWRGSPFILECRALLMAWLADALIITFVLDTIDLGVVYSKPVIYTWLVAILICLLLWRGSLRLVLRILREQGFNTRSVAIVGAGDTGVRVCETIKGSPWTGLVLAGFYEDRIIADERVKWEGSIQGDFNDLVNKARKGEIDLVYLTLPMSAQPRIMELIERLADTTASVYLVPDFFVCNLFHGKWHSLEGVLMVSVFDTPFLGVVSVLKRIQDVVLASLILMIIALPMVIIALLIKLTSLGPIIFKQRRYGVNGKEIYVWKFRSMHVMENDGQIIQAKRNDGRITPIGRILRRTSFDELPQFINVLMGDMSIVGPRPHAVAHNEIYRHKIKGYMLRHTVKPGITGWAQINGWRGETAELHQMEKRIEYDLWYIRNWTLWLDMKIIFLTIFRGFSDDNAF